MESQENKATETGKHASDNFEEFYFEDTSYITTLNKKFKNRPRWKPKDPKKIFAVIPGTIVDVIATEGQELKKGEPILILEAMKMRNVVCMPIDGIIKSIQVDEGAIVPKGHLLIDID